MPATNTDSLVQVENALLIAGIVFVASAIIGGGLKAFHMEVPVIETGRRQLLLGAFGGALILFSLFPRSAGERLPGSGAADVESTAGAEPNPGTTSHSPTGSGPPPPSEQHATGADGACVVRVTHSFAELKSERHPHASGATIPVGQHVVLDSATEQWAGQPQRWLKLRVGGREGWLMDRAMFIGERSAACP